MIRFTEIPFVGVTVEWYTGGAAWRLERFRWLVSGRQCGMRGADRPDVAWVAGLRLARAALPRRRRLSALRGVPPVCWTSAVRPAAWGPTI
jgi:hypothetical protein